MVLDAGGDPDLAAAAAHAVAGLPRDADPRDLAAGLVAALDGRADDVVVRRLLARLWLAASHEPVLVMIGGTSGTGKSTVSVEVAERLGIARVIGTDVVREVMRVTLGSTLLPALHASTFDAGNRMRTNLDTDRLIRAFEQQTAIVQQGVIGAVRRVRKEGVPAVINGVHLVGGNLAELDEFAGFRHWCAFILTVSESTDHLTRFDARGMQSSRDADYYSARIEAIRALDEYIRRVSVPAGARVVNNDDFDTAVTEIVDAVVDLLEPEWSGLLD